MSICFSIYLKNVETAPSWITNALREPCGGYNGRMGDQAKLDRWPVLRLDDAALEKELRKLLTGLTTGNAYSDDGTFAESLSPLPPGLRAMGATHWLDISLTLDSITWHFGNFGEPKLVAQTKEGLSELGLHELAACFREAKELMVPLLSQRKEEDGDPYEILEQRDLRHVGRALDKRAWALGGPGPGRSAIYEAWIRHAREHPERVFPE